MKRQNVRAIFEAGKRAMRLFVRRWPMKNHRTRQRGIGYQRGEGVGGGGGADRSRIRERHDDGPSHRLFMNNGAQTLLIINANCSKCSHVKRDMANH